MEEPRDAVERSGDATSGASGEATDRTDGVSIVVSCEWLADRLTEPGLHVLDVRESWEYEGIGHLPGAVNVPFDRFRDEAGEADPTAATDAGEAADAGTAADEDGTGMLPGADVFADLFGGAGIAPDDRVVVYDDTHGVFAARVLVTARLYGHDRVHLLDGDYSAWNRTYETTTDVPNVDAVDYAVDPPEATPLIDRAGVERAIDGDDVLVDTRDDWEFEEGHLPGAVNLDWTELVDEETRGLKPRDELEAILEGHGVTRDRRIVLYCNTARRISHTFVALTLLGYDDVWFYEGSLREWGAAGGRLATGSE